MNVHLVLVILCQWWGKRSVNFVSTGHSVFSFYEVHLVAAMGFFLYTHVSVSYTFSEMVRLLAYKCLNSNDYSANQGPEVSSLPTLQSKSVLYGKEIWAVVSSIIGNQSVRREHAKPSIKLVLLGQWMCVLFEWAVEDWYTTARSKCNQSTRQRTLSARSVLLMAWLLFTRKCFGEGILNGYMTTERLYTTNIFRKCYEELLKICFCQHCGIFPWKLSRHSSSRVKLGNAILLYFWTVSQHWVWIFSWRQAIDFGMVE